MRRVTVAGPTPYEVVIGAGAQAELALALAGTPRAVPWKRDSTPVLLCFFIRARGVVSGTQRRV